MAAMFDTSLTTDRFLPLQQSAPYAMAVRACGGRVVHCDLGIGWAQIVRRGPLRLISRGPVWDDGTTPDERRAALRRLARWTGLTVATPQDDLRGFGLIPLITPVHHALWDLSGDARGRMTGKWRNRLSMVERAGQVVRAGGTAELAFLVDAAAAQGRLRRYRAYSAAFTRGLPAASLRCWTWRDDKTIGAAMAFVRHGTSASYHLGWAGDAARAAGIHNQMLWHAGRALAAEGVRWLDLGLVSDANPGLAHFKLGTGATLLISGHTLLVVPS